MTGQTRYRDGAFVRSGPSCEAKITGFGPTTDARSNRDAMWFRVCSIAKFRAVTHLVEGSQIPGGIDFYGVSRYSRLHTALAVAIGKDNADVKWKVLWGAEEVP